MLAGLSRYPRTPTIVHTSIDSPRSILHEHVDNMDSGSDSDSDVRGGGDFEMEIESSWSCVSQHGVGNHLFLHNLVTISGRLNWSLQVRNGHTAHSTPVLYSHFLLLSFSFSMCCSVCLQLCVPFAGPEVRQDDP